MSCNFKEVNDRSKLLLGKWHRAGGMGVGPNLPEGSHWEIQPNPSGNMKGKERKKPQRVSQSTYICIGVDLGAPLLV